MAHAPLHHPALGDFVFDEALDWHQGTLRDGRVRLYVTDGSSDAVRAALDEIAATLPSLDDAAAASATADLLDLKNTTWLEEDESEVSVGAFRTRLCLAAVTVGPDGLTFDYDDGDLFWGHTVRVERDVDRRWSGAHLVG